MVYHWLIHWLGSLDSRRARGRETRVADGELCGKWMPRAKAYCARGPGHPPLCASPEAIENHRVRRRGHVRNDPPEAVKRWKCTHLLKTTA
jgi:hypothetical protein